MDLLNCAPVLAEDAMLELRCEFVEDGVDGALVSVVD